MKRFILAKLDTSNKQLRVGREIGFEIKVSHITPLYTTVVTCISDKMALFINSKYSTIFYIYYYEQYYYTDHVFYFYNFYYNLYHYYHEDL